MADDLTERLADLACQGLREMAEDFEEALGRRPTPWELCELLAYGIQSSREDLLEDVSPSAVTALRPRLSNGAGRAPDQGGSGVDELDDDLFSEANGLITDLAHAYRGESDSYPTLATLCGVIVEALHRCGAEVISGARPEEVVAIDPETRGNPGGGPRPGDIVAIPAPDGRYFTAVVLTENQAGTAYGIFEGTRDAEPVSSSSAPPAVRHPIYSGDELVRDGTWPIVGHDDGLLELFPSEPEVFRGAPLMPDVEPDIGPFGSAETPSGERRDLTEEEAEEIGLSDDSYSEFFPPEVVADYLADREAKRS